MKKRSSKKEIIDQGAWNMEHGQEEEKDDVKKKKALREKLGMKVGKYESMKVFKKKFEIEMKYLSSPAATNMSFMNNKIKKIKKKKKGIKTFHDGKKKIVKNENESKSESESEPEISSPSFSSPTTPLRLGKAFHSPTTLPPSSSTVPVYTVIITRLLVYWDWVRNCIVNGLYCILYLYRCPLTDSFPSIDHNNGKGKWERERKKKKARCIQVYTGIHIDNHRYTQVYRKTIDHPRQVGRPAAYPPHSEEEEEEEEEKERSFRRDRSTVVVGGGIKYKCVN
ncbi:hypothetical protein H8356DRAFT_1339484 [Neocallimastix lanati (nom. inval.)]|nr:hypothetical protein H8356DRAFT_1339484 [Neocallimastix sp. JGI-2020a]